MFDLRWSTFGGRPLVVDLRRESIHGTHDTHGAHGTHVTHVTQYTWYTWCTCNTWCTWFTWYTWCIWSTRFAQKSFELVFTQLEIIKKYCLVWSHFLFRSTSSLSPLFHLAHFVHVYQVDVVVEVKAFCASYLNPFSRNMKIIKHLLPTVVMGCQKIEKSCKEYSKCHFSFALL